MRIARFARQSGISCVSHVCQAHRAFRASIGHVARCLSIICICFAICTLIANSSVEYPAQFSIVSCVLFAIRATVANIIIAHFANPSNISRIVRRCGHRQTLQAFEKYIMHMQSPICIKRQQRAKTAHFANPSNISRIVRRCGHRQTLQAFENYIMHMQSPICSKRRQCAKTARIAAYFSYAVSSRRCRRRQSPSRPSFRCISIGNCRGLPSNRIPYRPYPKYKNRD